MSFFFGSKIWLNTQSLSDAFNIQIHSYVVRGRVGEESLRNARPKLPKRLFLEVAGEMP